MKKNLYRACIIGVICILCAFWGESFTADTKKVVKVGIYEMEGFHSYDEQNQLKGYCIDYLNVVSRVTGWKYAYVPLVDFSDGCEKLKKQEIDLLAPVMMTDARKETYAYSDMDFGTEYTVLLTTADREEIYYEDYAQFDELRVAVVKEYPLTEYFVSYMNTQGFSSELVYYDSIAQSREALANGEVDAIVDSIMNMSKDQRLLARFAPQPFYFLTYKENTAFLGELNNAMKQIQNTYPTLLNELLVMYYPIYELQFYTHKEMDYIEQGKVLKVAYIDDRIPLSFTDENGEFKGISRALFDRIAELSGLKFTYVALPTGSITYEYLQKQGIDLITGVEYNNANMNSKGIFLSRPYISGRKVMVSRPGFVYKRDESYKLGIIEGSQTLSTVLKMKYPNLETVNYKTIEECFQALYTKEVDMLIQNQYVVESLLLKPMYSDFTVISMEGLADELCFSTVVSFNGGLGMGEAESTLLIGILNKAISQITNTELDSILMSETLENQYKIEMGDFLYRYRYTIAAILAALSIFLIFVIIYFREMDKREKMLEEEGRRTALEKKRYQTIVECSDDLIYEISMDGTTSVGSEKIKEKFGWEIEKGIKELNFKKVMEILHVHPEDEAIFRQSQIANGEGGFDNLTVRIGKTDGSYIWCRLSRTILLDNEGRAVSFLGKIVDIDEEVKEKKRLEYRSRTDSLTGLLNKITFEKEVREYIERNSTKDACFIFIDMDHFKEINDRFGHSVGDQVIRETAKKIQLLFASFDTLGRFGGDEFCIFMKEMPRETLIDRLRFAVKKLEQDYPYAGGVVKLSASIGVAYCRRDGVGYKEMMDAADAAAYRAKDNGRNCYIIEDVE